MNNIMNNIKIIYKNKNQKQEILRDPLDQVFNFLDE